jgi:hypothetical protein
LAKEINGNKLELPLELQAFVTRENYGYDSSSYALGNLCFLGLRSTIFSTIFVDSTG